MKIVKFGDGKYGLRKGLIFYRYLDLQGGDYWWEKNGYYFATCRGSKERAEEMFGIKSDAGTPLEPSFLDKLINTIKSIEWGKDENKQDI